MYLVINKCVTAVKVSNFSGHYFRNRSTSDIGHWDRPVNEVANFKDELKVN
jgi:hypothetical protein